MSKENPATKGLNVKRDEVLEVIRGLQEGYDKGGLRAHVFRPVEGHQPSPDVKPWTGNGKPIPIRVAWTYPTKLENFSKKELIELIRSKGTQ
jgi:hypothetical protein